MANTKKYRLFISHAWKYGGEYDGFVNLLNQSSIADAYSNYSVPEHDPVDAHNKTKLRRKLTDQMEPTNLVVILAGMYAAHSDWIQYEIDEAKRMGKTILGVKPYGNEVVPRVVEYAADEMVNWYTNSIVGAIKRLVP